MPHQGNNPGQLRAIHQLDLTAGKFALGVGWGADATVSTIGTGANDYAGSFIVTCAIGGGALAQATATVTMTFMSAFGAAPRAVIVTASTDNDPEETSVTATATTTALTITFGHLPVTTKLYTFNYALIA